MWSTGRQACRAMESSIVSLTTSPGAVDLFSARNSRAMRRSRGGLGGQPGEEGQALLDLLPTGRWNGHGSACALAAPAAEGGNMGGIDETGGPARRGGCFVTGLRSRSNAGRQPIG